MAQIALPGGIPRSPDYGASALSGFQKGFGTVNSILQFQQQKEQNKQTLAMEKQKQANMQQDRNLQIMGTAFDLLDSKVSMQQKMGAKLIHNLVQSSPEAAELFGDMDVNIDIDDFTRNIDPKAADAFVKINQKALDRYKKGEISKTEVHTTLLLSAKDLVDYGPDFQKSMQEQGLEMIEEQAADLRKVGEAKYQRGQEALNIKSKRTAEREATQLDYATGTDVPPEGKISPEMRLATEVEGLPTDDPRKTSLQNILSRKGKGVQETFRMNPDGTMEVIRGEDRGIGFKAREEEDIRRLYIAQDVIGDLSNELITLAENGETIGLTGTLQRKIDSTLSQMKAGTEIFVKGKKATVEELTSSALYNDVFKGNAAKSAAYRSTARKIGAIIAIGNNPRGKISDQDVRLAIEEAGVDTGSLNQLRASLAQVQKNMGFVVSATERAMGREPTRPEATPLSAVEQTPQDLNSLPLEELERMRDEILGRR